VKFATGDRVRVPAHKWRSDWPAYTGKVIKVWSLGDHELVKVEGHRGRSESIHAARDLAVA
jgi:hypothetical protein